MKNELMVKKSFVNDLTTEQKREMIQTDSLICNETGGQLKGLIKGNISFVRKCAIRKECSVSFEVFTESSKTVDGQKLQEIAVFNAKSKDLQKDQKIVKVADEIAKVAAVSFLDAKFSRIGIRVKMGNRQLDVHASRLYRTTKKVESLQELFFNLITLQLLAYNGYTLTSEPVESIEAKYAEELN